MTSPARTLQFPDHWKTMAAPAADPAGVASAVVTAKKTSILIAEDDRICREVLACRLTQAGYRVVVTCDGESAIQELRKPDAPTVAILDWLMPGMDGPTICKRMRDANRSIYLILLTSRTSKEDVVEGLDSGADDYLVKPFENGELLARVKVGFRIIGMQRTLADQVAALAAPQSSATEKLGVAIL